MENYFNYEKIKRGLKNLKDRRNIPLLVWLIIFLVLFWLIGLFSIPGHYKIIKPGSDGQVSQYLTNHILPELYNKSQYNQPFDLVVSEDGINDIIARQIDSNSLQRSGFSNLSVTFKRGRILLTGRTVYHGFSFVVTIVLKPYINKEGYFCPKVSKVQAGTSRIPFVAETMKRRVLYRLAGLSKDSGTADFVGMLFNSGKIEPVFSFNHRKLRIEKITVQNKQLTIQFLPE